MLAEIGEIGPVESGWGARGWEGIRVERDHYDGRITGWADVVVWHGGDEVSRMRLSFVKEATGWKVDNEEWEEEEPTEEEPSD